MKNIVFTLMAAVMFTSAWGQNPQYPPRDETYMDPELDIFVKNLLAAIEGRDQHFLYSVLDIDVSGIIGEAEGVENFKRQWHTDNDSSLVWPLMKRTIQLGGVFLHDSADHTGRYAFVFPYVYDMPLDIEDDYLAIGVVTGKKVNLREGPDTASPIKSQLTYDVIWFLDGDQYGKTQSGTNQYQGPEWYLVETYDRQKKGWVNWRYVYSPMDYRMFLYKHAKLGWRISAFVAGD